MLGKWNNSEPEAEPCPSFTAEPSAGRMSRDGANSRWRQAQVATAKVRACGGERTARLLPKGFGCLPDYPKLLKSLARLPAPPAPSGVRVGAG